MGNGDTACLLRVVLEVCLNILIGVVTDNLDRVFVSTNGTVTAKTPEFALNCTFSSSVGCSFFFERKICNIVYDTKCKVGLRSVLRKFFVDSKDAGRRSILRTKTISTADNSINLAAFRCKSCNNIEVKRLAQGTGFLSSIKNSNFLNCFRNSCYQMFSRERTIKAYLYKTYLLTICYHIIDNLFCNVTDRAHSDNNFFSIGCTVVVKEFIVCADFSINLVHILFNDSRNCIIILVAGLSMLEEDIAVLVRTAHYRTLGVKSAFAECINCIHIAHFFKIIKIPNLNFLNFVGSTETVKEVKEGNAALNSCQVSNCAKVHNFLCVCLSEHCKTCLAAGINVRMVAKNIKRVRSYATSRYVEYAREQLTCYFIHIGYHE